MKPQLAASQATKALNHPVPAVTGCTSTRHERVAMRRPLQEMRVIGGPGSPGRCQQADTYLVGQVTDRRIAIGQADTTD
jgi:hypothetical protein